jgi:peptide/nickel transport system permease protein
MSAGRRRRSGLGLTGKICAGILLALVLVALAPGLIARADPLAQDLTDRLAPPGSGHPFGTDGFGRDVFSRVVHGARVSLGCALAGVAAASLLGVSVGVSLAWRPRLAATILQGAVSVLLSVPFLLLALVIVVAMQPSFLSVTVAIAAGLVAPVARLSAAAARTVVCQPWIDAARTAGAGRVRILARHVLPNTASPILTQVTGLLGLAISAEATLSFLGLGIPAPYPSWGRMLAEGARQYLESAPWVAGFAGLAVAIAAVSASLLGDALRDLVTRRTPRG